MDILHWCVVIVALILFFNRSVQVDVVGVTLIFVTRQIRARREILALLCFCQTIKLVNREKVII